MICSTKSPCYRRPSFRRYLILACIIIFISLVIGGLASLGLIPNREVDIPQSTNVSSFNVKYLLVNSSTGLSSDLNVDSIDLTNMARSFETGLGLQIQNILQINNMYFDTATGMNSKTRRRRSVKCDQDVGGLNGPVLVIDFNLTYPVHRLCQTQQCVIQAFNDVYKQVSSVSSLSIDINNTLTELRLCSISVLSSTRNVTSISSTRSTTTRHFTSRSTTLRRLTSTLTTTEMPQTTSNIVSQLNFTTNSVTRSNTTSSTTRTPQWTTNTITRLIFTSNAHVRPNLTLSTTERPRVTSDTPTLSTILLTTTERLQQTSNMPSHSDFTSQTTESGNSISKSDEISDAKDGADTPDDKACLQKLPITQETVPPNRITHTSTLFFQDTRSLIVAGASKFETTLDIQGTKKHIIINGAMVYANCQRTTDVSLPIVCHSPLSACL